eukprot:1039323-Prorocentrum_lima.AAC.1
MTSSLVGSEMCIRDRKKTYQCSQMGQPFGHSLALGGKQGGLSHRLIWKARLCKACGGQCLFRRGHSKQQEMEKIGLQCSWPGKG